MILLDLLDTPSPYETFRSIDLNNIEPFTAVIWDDARLFECRWDGQRKHSKEMDRQQPHIWSSCTLYDEEVVTKRKQWFTNWLQQHPNPTQDDILHFHQFTGDGDAHNDLLMDRDGKVFTVSVTSVAMQGQKALLEYVDVKSGNTELEEIVFVNTSVAKA